MFKAKITDALRRAVRTFFQAAGAYLVFNPDHAVTPKVLAAGAFGAGIAAVWRMVDPDEPEPGPKVPSTKTGTSAGKL